MANRLRFTVATDCESTAAFEAVWCERVVADALFIPQDQPLPDGVLGIPADVEWLLHDGTSVMTAHGLIAWVYPSGRVPVGREAGVGLLEVRGGDERSRQRLTQMLSLPHAGRRCKAPYPTTEREADERFALGSTTETVKLDRFGPSPGPARVAAPRPLETLRAPAPRVMGLLADGDHFNSTPPLLLVEPDPAVPDAAASEAASFDDPLATEARSVVQEGPVTLDADAVIALSVADEAPVAISLPPFSLPEAVAAPTVDGAALLDAAEAQNFATAEYSPVDLDDPTRDGATQLQSVADDLLGRSTLEAEEQIPTVSSDELSGRAGVFLRPVRPLPAPEAFAPPPRSPPPIAGAAMLASKRYTARLVWVDDVAWPSTGTKRVSRAAPPGDVISDEDLALGGWSLPDEPGTDARVEAFAPVHTDAGLVPSAVERAVTGAAQDAAEERSDLPPPRRLAELEDAFAEFDDDDDEITKESAPAPVSFPSPRVLDAETEKLPVRRRD